MRLSSKFRNVLLSIKILVICVSLQVLASCSDGVNSTENNDIRTPQNLIANPGARTVNLNWQGDSAATGYTVYWEVDNAVDSKEAANVETVAIPHFEHTALTNGATYYYRVSANKGSKESALSVQVQATPMPLPPEKPQVFDQANPSTDGFRAFVGNARVTLDWPMDTSEGAIKYTVLWQIGAGVSPDSARRIEDVVPPFVHQGLDNGQLYSYRLVGVNDEGESEPSDEITATPQLPLPSTPVNLRAAETSNPGQITLLWDQFDNADSFELYWSTDPEVSLSSAYVSNLQSPFVHAPLQDGQAYYYKVRSINSAGASDLSGTLQATAGSGSPQQYQPPAGSAPAAPSSVRLQPGDGQVKLQWQPVAGASGYLIYWNTTGNVSEADARVNSAPVNVFLDTTENNEERVLYVHTGLTNGQIYYYRIAAYNSVGQTLGSQVGPVRAEKIVPGRPANMQVIGGDERIGVRWNPVHNAESYNIYWKQAGFGDETTTGTLITDVSSPFTIVRGTHELDTNGGPNGAALTNGTAYEVRVEAIAASGAVGCQPQQEVDGVTPKPVPCTDWMEVTPQIPPPAAPDGMRLVPGDGEITMQWKPVTAPPEETIFYHVYSGDYSGVRPEVSDTNGIRQVSDSASVNYDAATQLYSLTDTNLTNGKRYYYIVTASNAGGESLPSRELWAIPQIATPQSPRGLLADAGDTQVTLTWAAPDESASYNYNVYYRIAGNPNPIVIPNAGTDPTPDDAIHEFNHTISDLENGVSYYFKVSAINEGGEGVFSSEVNATPYLPPPQQAPSGLTITGGDGQIALSWESVAGADYYNVYWSTATPINFSNAPRIQVSDGSTDVLHQGLQNGTTYYYRITAANGGGESAPSDLVFATAQISPPASPPGNFTAVAGDAQVRFDWNLVNTAQSYLLYWSTDLNLPLNQWVRVSGVEPGYIQSGLTNGNTYHYFLRAANAGGQGPASTTMSVIPQQPPPATPSGFSVSAGDVTVNINWDSQAGVSYNLYWSTSPNVTLVNSTVVPNVTSTYVHSSLVNDTTYYYRLAAVNAGGQSPLSTELSATPAVIPPGAPVGVSAQGRDGQNELRWFAPSGASATTTYNIYWSTSPGAGTSGSLISNASSPYVHTGLTNGTTYYYVVTAVDGAESSHSLQASATPRYPQVGLPSNFYAQAGIGEVQLTWSAAANAQFYTIYWSNDPNDASPQQIQVAAPATQYLHENLNNGDTYYYRISAGNLGGISDRSSQVQARPDTVPVQNTPPTGASLSNSTVPENSATNTVVGTLSAIDPDTGDTHTFTMASGGDAGGRFAIINGNQVAVANGALLDYEAAIQHSIVVEVRDLGGNGAPVNQTLTINVTDVNEAPSITSPANATIAENMISAFTVAGSDPENDSISFRITGGADGSVFYMVPGNLPNTAELRFIQEADYEIPADVGGDNVYNVQITATDGSNDSAAQSFQLTITDVATENSILGIFPDSNLQLCVNEYASLNDWKYTYEITGKLECKSKGITDLTGMEQLTNLQGLDLSGNSITNVTPLAGLTQLTELWLASNNLNSLASPDLIGIDLLDSVTTLRLEYNNISDFSPLTGMASLSELIVWYNNFNDLMVSNIASLTNLSKLWLQGNPISDVNALAPTNFPNLVDLGMSNLGLTITSPAEIVGLGSLINLQVLYLQENGLTDTNGLENLTNLRELWLYGNQIRSVQGITGLNTLVALGLGKNGLTSAGLVSGLDQLSSLQELWLGENTMTDITALDNQNFRDNLTRLYLYTNQIADISILENLTNLQILYINENQPLTDISWLAGLDALTELNLGLTNITNIDALANKSNLLSLGISVISGITDYTPLSTLGNLEYLYAGEAGIDDTNVSMLSSLTKLKELYLWGNSAISDISGFSGMTSLEVLDLTSNSVTSLVGISGLSKLRRLGFVNNQVSDLSPLQNLYGLKNLYLNDNNISDATGLAGLVGLSELNLIGNNLTDAAPLSGLKYISRLNLRSNQLGASSNVDQLVSYWGPVQIDLYLNQAIDCNHLQTLVDAYPADVVFPPSTPDTYCTDYAAVNSTASVSSNWAVPTAGDTVTITVQAFNGLGDPKSAGGDAVEITAQYTSANFNLNVPLQVTDNGNGTYTASYTANIAGQDIFIIKINSALVGPKDVPDSNGVLNGELTIDLVANQQPTAIISEPADGAVLSTNVQTAFGSTGSIDPDGHTPLSYQWTFTQGGSPVASSNLPDPTMTFSASGAYSVELIVSDALGVASTPVSISFQVAVPLAGLFPSDANLQTCADVTGFTYAYEVGTLDCSGADITNLSGIENLTNLNTLWMINNPNLDDLSPLSNPSLNQLRSLYLSNNTTTNNASLNAVLANMVNLTNLRIDNTGITDISALSNLSALDNLQIQNNPIADFTVLASPNLSTLTSLNISNTGFSNTALLAGLVNLISLWASDNLIVDVAPIGQNLTNLQRLDLRANIVGGLNVGNLDDLVHFTNPTMINLLENPTSSCSEMNLVIHTYNSVTQPVSPTNISVGSHCTIDALETLNDTGKVQCTDTVNALPCPVAAYPGQDGDFGRDPAAINDNANGFAGFVFTKLAADGTQLPLTATSWACVKDEVTGFVWEVKTNDGSVHDVANTYTWYDPSNLTNGGDAGDSTGSTASCTGTVCNTQALIDALNATNYCGFADWRLPTMQELNSVVHYGASGPAMDTQFFPNVNTTTSINYHWSSQSSVSAPASAAAINLSSGASSTYTKSAGHAVILMRGNQKR